jgi:hypothetical protein
MYPVPDCGHSRLDQPRQMWRRASELAKINLQQELATGSFDANHSLQDTAAEPVCLLSHWPLTSS